MARAANTGVSCLVDARGRMHQATGVLSGVQVVRGSLVPGARDTVYVRYGDWPLFLAGVLVVVSVVVAVLRRKKNR
jgi:apolipoprotein N-acyltransferase